MLSLYELTTCPVVQVIKVVYCSLVLVALYWLVKCKSSFILNTRNNILYMYKDCFF